MQNQKDIQKYQNNKSNKVPQKGDTVALNVGNKQKRTEYSDIYIPEHKSLIDKTPQFNNVLLKPYFYNVNWIPYVIYERWVGMKCESVSFRRGMKSSIRWQTLFARLLEMENDVYLSNFMDHAPDIVKFQIIVFESKYLQMIDGMIGDAMRNEAKEYISYIDKKFDDDLRMYRS